MIMICELSAEALSFIWLLISFIVVISLVAFFIYFFWLMVKALKKYLREDSK